MKDSGCRVSSGEGDRNVLRLDGCDVVAQLLSILKPLNYTLEKSKFYGIRTQCFFKTSN